MRVLIAAGGTAGHVNPALAIAEKIKKEIPTAQIHFAGCKNGMEARLVAQHGYPFHNIEVRGIQRKLNFENVVRNIKAVNYLALSIPRANAILKEVNPDLVIGTGGYVSGPVLQAAARKGIKTAIHEQNAFPGVTNKILASRVDLLLVAMPDAVQRLGAQNKTAIVGNPVRAEMFVQNKADNRKKLGVSQDTTLILSFGGSLGAMRINEVVADLAKWEIEKSTTKIHHIHATGSIEKLDFEQLAKEKAINNSESFEIREYIDNMPALLSAADIVISRAGALTLAEIAAVGRASVLIPSPNVAENHQYHNAMQLQKAGAAVVIEEKNLTSNLLIETISKLVEDKANIDVMGLKARTLGEPHSVDKIWQQLKNLINTVK